MSEYWVSTWGGARWETSWADEEEVGGFHVSSSLVFWEEASMGRSWVSISFPSSSSTSMSTSGPSVSCLRYRSLN